MSPRTVGEELRAWRELRAAHDRDCRVSFVAGLLVGAVTLLGWLVLTGGV